MTVTAIYPGTFDPITNGHIDIIIRSLKSFDHIIVGIGPNPKKTTLFSLEERISMVKECLSNIPNASSKISVEAFDGLLVDFAKKQNASVIIRGLRAISDFEYEFQMALMNRKLDSEIETVFLMPSEEYSYLTSSIIKVVPTVANEMLKLKFKK